MFDPDRTASFRTVPGEESIREEMETHIPQFGRYQNLEFIGEGGMARVYRAYDPTLGRPVALKFLKGDNEILGRRLLAEARAQAKIEQKNVCKVYEVGNVDNKLYIAMQYIQGRPLKEYTNLLTLEQKIKIFLEVAEAVQAAHRVGLIHRDLKPSNIMLEKTEDDQWVPYVMDFGLARETQSEGMTVSGTILGSPWYMSPEQARGEIHKLDRRTDIYSLGVTLYELLCGKLPFEGNNTFEILTRVIQDDPPALRTIDPSLPVDLESIILKCLEKEKERRYDSAKALAEDLSRFLAGEPVTARPSSTLYKVYRKARKQKALTATIAIAALLVFFFSALSYRTLVQSRQQARIAQELGQQVKEMEILLRIGSMLPLHDIRKERNLVQQKMMVIQKRLPSLSSIERGPAYYALGRGALALQDPERARTYLEKAWKEHDYRIPEVAFALGLSHGLLYRQKLRELLLVSNKEAREMRKKKIEKEYLLPALENLKNTKGMQDESSEYLSALIALCEKRYEEAIQKADNSLRHISWLYEAMKIKAEAFLALGAQHEDGGNYQPALEAYRSAGRTYQQAAEIARSDPEVYEGLCEASVSILRVLSDSGGVPDSTFDSHCNEALKANPESSRAWNLKAHGHWLLAYYKLYTGHSPDQNAKASVQAATRAIELNRNFDFPYYNRCCAKIVRAKYLMSLASDPTFELEAAIQDCSRATRITSGFVEAFNSLGIAWKQKAEYLMQTGKDAAPAFQESIRSFEKGLEANPRFTLLYSNLGNAWLAQADYLHARGIDTRPYYRKAIEIYQKALQMNPDHPYALNNMGAAYRELARYELDHGQNPEENIDQSIRCYRKAMEANPRFSLAYCNLGQALTDRLEYDPSRATELYQQAETAIKKALEINPSNENAYSSYVQLNLTMQEHTLRKNMRDGRWVSRALATLAKAERAGLQWPELPAEWGKAFLLQGRVHMTTGRSPLKELDKAETYFSQLPPHWNWLSAKEIAECWWWRGHWWELQGRKKEARNAWKRAAELAEGVIQRNPDIAVAYAIRGAALVRSGEEQKGKELLTKAFNINSYLQRDWSKFP